MRTNRRQFLKTVGATAVAGVGASMGSLPAAETTIVRGEMNTVRGLRPVGDFSVVLPHEHLTTDFIGAEMFPQPRYDRDLAFDTLLPHLRRVRERGVSALFECTPNHIGRDVQLLRRLSEATDLHIVSNTGYYGAVGNKYLPQHAYEETAKQLAARWLKEWNHGIDDTDIRPGFIKLGVDRGELPPLHAKLVRAAAIVHKETGATICIHTGDGEAALDELRILEQAGIAPEAFVWVHAQNDAGPIQIEVAKRGGWVSLDGYSVAAQYPKRYVNMVMALKDAGCLGRVLISHDDGFAVDGDGERSTGFSLFGGNPAPYIEIFDRFRPDLMNSGFAAADWDRLTTINPLEAFALRQRLI